ncbi:MAG TPA: Holliday junction branch migration protein RuvA [Candidatus Polarisedimenticolaceae bacterium]|nr:Holliday junction branch migration protein RuvA [Candidatus Polarisedimenticolaceae bacterium]
MIGRLTGRLVDCEPGSAVLDVGGVGYELRIPLSTYYRLSARPEPAVLFVHTHVREDALALFGFATREERAAFERLISISGVGPRMALAVLSGIGVEDLSRAVAEGDRARLERIPGIGRKTAERVLLELKDKKDEGRPERATASAGPAGESGIRADAVSALLNLGYPPDAARRAVEQAATEAEGSELGGLLRAALRRLVR